MNATMMQMLLKSLGINADDIEKQVSVFASNAKLACDTLVRLEKKIDLILAKEGIIYEHPEQPKQLPNSDSATY